MKKTLLIHLKEKTVPQFILDKLFEIVDVTDIALNNLNQYFQSLQNLDRNSQ